MKQNSFFSDLIAMALMEDVGSGDISAKFISETEVATAHVLTREALVLSGAPYFNEVFRQVDLSIHVTWHYKDSNLIEAGQTICSLKGNAKGLLTGERTALNFLQTLSGTATLTHKLANLIKHTSAKLLDTRKTIPGLRQAQKYAVRCGGGFNHRMGLYDAFLIKENHIRAAGGMAYAVKQARIIDPTIPLEVEVRNLKELEIALDNQVPRVLLDNFQLNDIKQAVLMTHQRAELEASGGITEENIVAVAETGVDFISVGAITKNVKAIDLTMLFD